MHNSFKIFELLKGEKLTFKEFFERFYPTIVVFAQKYVVEKEIAEDICQDAFIKAYESDNSFKSIDNLKAFIYTLTKNSCLNYVKHAKVEEKYKKLQPGKDDNFFRDTIIEQETYRMLYQAIDTLPKRSKKIIELSLNDMTNPEIAEELDISLNTVKTLKNRTYRKLRELLKEHKLAILLFLSILNS